jgi:DNA-binding transcriptional ArsR family regulator
MIERTTMEPLADLLGALAHPDRLRLVMAIGDGECDVASLSAEVELSQPRTSQHLALLRAHHVVEVRKDGRRSLYSLTHPELLPWLAQAAHFLERDATRAATLADHLSALLGRVT